MTGKRNLNSEPFERGELHDITLADIRLSDLEVMIRRGQFLTLAELAKALNISYSDIKRAKREGLPLVYGKIRYETAVAWLEARAAELTLEAQPLTHYR
jgi:hypothetical protein